MYLLDCHVIADIVGRISGVLVSIFNLKEDFQDGRRVVAIPLDACIEQVAVLKN